MNWYRAHKVRIATILMVIIVIGIASMTPGQHLWMWLPILLSYLAWQVDKRRRESAGEGPREAR
jgi:hypothetical protein